MAKFAVAADKVPEDNTVHALRTRIFVKCQARMVGALAREQTLAVRSLVGLPPREEDLEDAEDDSNSSGSEQIMLNPYCVFGLNAIQALQSTSGPSCLPPAVNAELRLLAVKKQYVMFYHVICQQLVQSQHLHVLLYPLLTDPGKSASELKKHYASIGHFHYEKRPKRFVRIMQDKRCKSRLVLPNSAASLLQASNLSLPRFINLETSTGCGWRVELKQEDGMLELGALWCAFAKFHGLKLGCVVEFEVVHPELMKVNIYNEAGIEVTYTLCGDVNFFTSDK
ncbi:hypothetical protein TRIUR3_21617 [Triticum urartu]|uniref:Uncharacterized protein n=1 Tax=Triticum urartu TaxID=4572 RepID=M7ZTA8_TRIUA|nr:hypothetical protein TRIUR3_21617 [Triticum urartu]